MESERETENQDMAIHQLSQYLKTGWEKSQRNWINSKCGEFLPVCTMCAVFVVALVHNETERETNY